MSTYRITVVVEADPERAVAEARSRYGDTLDPKEAVAELLVHGAEVVDIQHITIAEVEAESEIKH